MVEHVCVGCTNAVPACAISYLLSCCANAQSLAEGELAPGLSAAEFADRRARLARLLPPGSVAIVPGAAKNYRTGAIPYPYRQVRVCFAALPENTHASSSYAWAAPQDADFLYLTGIVQQAVAVISALSVPNHAHYTLFVPNANRERERWDGTSINCEAAVHVFGADEAYPVSEVAPL